MPKRRKLTKRDIEILTHPVTLRIFLGVAAGVFIFLVGIVGIILFAGLLRDFGSSGEFTSSFIILGILVLIVLALATIVGLSVFLIVRYKRAIEEKYRSLQIANIDLMPGIEFEHYLQRLLTSQGYSVNVTKASGDLGVDLIASRNGDKYAVQAKRYSGKVDRRAVSDAVTGRYHYSCNKAMVITNNYFTPDAITLARSSGCILVDRDVLAQWVTQFQNAKE